jgi:hypothetical protein
MKETTKAIEKLRELIYAMPEIDSWEQQKQALRYIIQQHINNAYMIDQRYYKEYINLYHDILTELNEI